MKTTMIARCVFAGAAIFAAAGLMGCGAENGQGESGAIGSTSEALSRAALAAIPTTSPDARTRAASACTFKNSTDLYHVLAGGIANVGGASSSIWVAKNNGAMVLQTATLSAARARAKVVRIDDTHCALIGGSNQAAVGGTPSAAVDILAFSADNGASTITRTTGTSLSAATEGFVLSTCKDSGNPVKTHLLIIGGNNGQNVIVGPPATVADLTTAGVWATPASVLFQTRKDFDADTDGDNHFMVAGGIVAGGGTAPSNTAELFTLGKSSTTCLTNVTATNTATTLSTPTKGNVVHYDASSATFIVTKGITRSGGVDVLWTNGDIVTATFTGTPDITFSSALGTIAGAYQPAKVRVSANAALFIGGANAAVNSSIATIDEYTGGGSLATPVTLGTATYQGAAAPIENGLVDYLAGDSTPGTYGTLAEAITP